MRRRLTVGWLLLALAWAGCDTHSQQQEFADRASATPQGYTETDAGGKVLSEDEDDWLSSPLYVGKVRVDPAYPNPVPLNEFVSIPVTVLGFDVVRGGLTLRAFDEHGRFIELDDPISGASGTDVFTFSAALLGEPGLHRVFVFDGLGEIVSYGDIMVR